MTMLPFLSLFLSIAGLIIGLGAVIVIDLHGFLARRSKYWTDATIRTHRVTKPLIWIGILLFMSGVALLHRAHLTHWIPLTHLGLSLILIINGGFLSFWLSPRLLAREANGRGQELLPQSWQRAIATSLIFSDIGWWANVVLLIYTLTNAYVAIS